MIRIAIAVVLIGLGLLWYRAYHRTKQVSIPSSTTTHQLENETVIQGHVGPPYSYPKPEFTPGAIDPRVTQGNIDETICVAGYTKTIRPPESSSHRLKLEIMRTYSLEENTSDYELDHFIPLELGGCPGCVSNLWPEPYFLIPGARQKDRVESFLHRKVCSGEMSLADAQTQIASDWIKVLNELESH